MSLSRINRKLFSRVSPTSTEKAQIKAIKASGKFDRAHYVKLLKGTKNQYFWSLRPELHYLRYGADSGLNPSPWFDTNWYKEQYDDVRDEGVNPLVHYALFGKGEGRKPNGKQYNRYVKGSVEDIRFSIVNHLWGGYSEPALAKLERVYSDTHRDLEVRFFAAWQAARWYYFVDDYETALSLGQFILTLDEDFKSQKVTVMILGYSLMHLGRKAEARDVFNEFLSRKPDDADILLSLSNVVESEEERLECINKAYTERDYVGIEKIDANQPLSFANITASAPPVIDKEHKVSVVIPTYNSEDRLGIAIQSLLNQSWQNLEVIVVDDCSPDGTFEVAKAFAEKDPRVVPVQQSKNGGAYRARNLGLKHASGQFITTHDGDDWSHPQKIETQMRFLSRNPNVKGVCTHWTRALNNLEFSHNWRLNPRLIHWSHSSFLFRREVLDELGVWDTVVAGGDTEFIWRIQSHYRTWSVKNIQKALPMAFALDDEGSLTRNKATHVKTIHNGLRHIYRSACEWWHKHHDDLYMRDSESRPFVAPQAMVTRGHTSLNCDVIFVGDFSESLKNSLLYKSINAAVAKGKKVGLYHWPIYGRTREDLNGQFFELLQDSNVHPIVFGMEVTAAKAVFGNTTLFSEKLEQRAELTAAESFVLTNGQDQSRQDNAVKLLDEFYSMQPKFVDVEDVEQDVPEQLYQ